MPRDAANLRVYRRERRRNAAARGLCLSCLVRPPRRGYKQCRPCILYLNRRRRSAAARGLCNVCALRKAAAGRRSCPKCRRALGAVNRARVAKRLRQGVCPDCGAHRKTPKRLCARCHQRALRLNSKYHAAARRAGLCHDCPLPRLPGKSKCRRCLDKDAAAMRRRHGNFGTVAEPFYIRPGAKFLVRNVKSARDLPPP